ncbi:MULTISPECIES: hypothetical protein [unclassified Cyanobium]|uniref:hypothetical protein n=1 Tax=unclassified Cyanobium TaxID=2627006 RepID=UPI0020CE2609|nr:MULTISPECIES: hypothetical protein [unclassified Cyanobium]MCP9833990.1 hypothetical protein [Cyanobium sp. La Preciosa 7G6]MCP9936753.1 hypothetical protein [Cyanobium sp. Aljojuca 7A6]
MRSHRLLLTALAAALAWPAASAATPAGSAVVQEILDGNELFIERRQARLMEKALAPELVRTQNSRGQLGFASGAAGRLNRFTQLRLGSTCFLLSSGQILVSGSQNGCTRSSRLSTRGTNYVITLRDGGEQEVAVLEGSVELQPLADGRPLPGAPILVAGGTRVGLSSQGALLWQRPLTADDYAAILRGPLFEGFTAPLPGMAALEAFVQRRFPGVIPAPTSPSLSRDPLVEIINRYRAQGGRPALQPLPAALAAQNATYLAPVLEGVLASGDCDHDRSLWDAFQNRMAGSANLMPTSEVIACPMPAGAWNPEAIVSRWMGSPLHTQILINRPRARSIDCVRLERSGRVVAICTLWSPVAERTP